MDKCPNCGSLIEDVGQFLHIWECEECGYNESIGEEEKSVEYQITQSDY